MCGILGVLYHGSLETPDQERLEASARLLHHRGPDHQAVFAGEGIGLVHTRLALLDLNPRSNQPFWDRTGQHALVYNGEIYNYLELRAELEARGIQFRTTSDTEVLLECLINQGVDATLSRLEGMFAFALYDKEERSLVLARDRFGIKPLHVCATENQFVFASEIRAMRPWVPFRADVLSISSYIQGFGGPTQGYTFYQNIRIVPPGTTVSVSSDGHAHWRRFWHMSDFWDPTEVERLGQLRPKQVVDAVEEALFESVRGQLVADAPVGALCSGGVDSSLTMAMAARFHNHLAIFHANVIGPHSEYEAAAKLAKHLRLDLKTVAVVDQDSIDSMPEVIQHYGHPFTYHLNSVPFLMVSKLVRDHRVKAILSGEGADECYVGYPWLIFNLRAAVVRSLLELPRVSWHLARGLARRLIGRAMPAIISEDDATVVQGLHNRFESDMEKAELRNAVRDKAGREPTDRDLVTLNYLSYHLRTLLHRNDCLGMATSIEARFPFLDSRLVRLAVNMPYKLKVRFSPSAVAQGRYFLRDKWVLREVAARYLPPELAYRKKMGFPTNAQYRMKIRPELFAGSFVADLFGLTDREVRHLLERGSQQLRLRLLHLEMWARVCLEGPPIDRMSSRLRDHVSMQTRP